jgi:hemerythrin-like metal-binding protein
MDERRKSMKWDHSLSIGIKEIDEQHQELVSIINQVEVLFKQSMEGGSDISETHKIIETLSAYAASHFEKEEQLMTKFGYPHLDEHMKEHEYFVKYVDDMTIEKITQSEETALIQLFAFLSDWVVSHIKKEDFEYKAFINKA